MGLFDWILGKKQPAVRRRKRVILVSPKGKRYSFPADAKAVQDMKRLGWRQINPGRMTTAERAGLPDSAFAAPSIRALPIHDAAHVHAALGRYSQTVFPSRAEAVAAARRIVKAAKRHGVPVRESSTVAQMAGLYIERIPERRNRNRR